ncbi:MAG TPA: FAD-dependent oxidoreductase [Chryseosolibacter sp.]
MKKSDETDVIIVGQGLAGSALAMRLSLRNYKILVIDEPSQNRSSMAAAGLFNPVTGKNMVKTWLADDLFPCLIEYYSEIETLTKAKFFYPMPIYRPFTSIQDQNQWMGRSVEDAYSRYIAEISTAPRFGEKINDPFGGVTFRQAGYVDTPSYLQAVRKYLVERGVFQAQHFDEDKLEVHGDFILYGSRRAKKIIFCQGARNATNRWFNRYPVQCLKGELLKVHCGWQAGVILVRGIFMVPGPGGGEWKIGATYNRADQEPGITAAAREEMTRKLDDLIRIPYTVTAQDWGVRPTTPDRRPIIGRHPQYDSLMIFNGFGTKGVSLAPYFSEVLIRWMENKGTMNKEADVSRFN